MLRVEITNFESIDHAVVEINGFTTVQGPNYSGKSATMRAIHAALTNPAGTGCISWGQKFCEVRLQAEGLDLLWHKEEGNSFYRVNGKSYEKIGRDEPPAEVGDLGYGTIRINGERHNLHFADQFNPLFLVDEQSTRNSDLIASAYGLDRLYKASELCSRDQRSAESMLKVRLKDLGFVTKDLEKFDGLDDVLKAASELKSTSISIAKQEAAVYQARQWLSTIAQISSECNRMKPALSATVPESEDLSKDSSACSTASKMLSRMESCAAEVQSLEPVKGVGVPDSEELSGRVESHRSTLSLLQRYEKSESDLKALRGVVDVRVSDSSEFAAVSKDLESLLFLKKSLSDMVTMKGEVESLQQSAEACAQELSLVEEEKAKFGECPLCGSKL